MLATTRPPRKPSTINTYKYTIAESDWWQNLHATEEYNYCTLITINNIFFKIHPEPMGWTAILYSLRDIIPLCWRLVEKTWLRTCFGIIWNGKLVPCTCVITMEIGITDKTITYRVSWWVLQLRKNHRT